MKRHLKLIASAACLAPLVLQGSIKSGAASGQPGKRGDHGVTVGALLSVTGSSSFIGEAERNTLTWLVADSNARGGIAGHRINLVVYDTAGDPAHAVSLSHRLIDSDHASVVIGPSTSGESLAVKDIFTRAQIPLLSLAASYKIVSPVSPWIFKIAQSDSLAVEKIYDYLRQRHVTRIALLTASDGFGASGREQLRRLASNEHLAIQYDQAFAPKATDFTAQLKRINAAHVQSVIVWGTNPGPAMITRNMRQLRMKQLLVQSPGVASSKFLELAGPAAEGTVLPAGKLLVASSLLASKQSSVLRQYTAGYMRKFHSPVSAFGGHAWDAFQLIARALAAGHTQPRQIREDIEGEKHLVGVTGVFHFSPTDHNGLDKTAFVMIRVTHGKWTPAR